MTQEEIAVQLNDHQNKLDEHGRRIGAIEEQTQSLLQLTTSVAVMAENLKNMQESLSAVADDLKAIKEKPARRWDTFLYILATAIISAGVGLIFAKLFGG